MAGKKIAKTKGLTSMQHHARGAVKHITIEPGSDGKGGLAFTSNIAYHRHPAAQKKMDSGGGYTPEPAEEKTMHANMSECVDHICDRTGTKYEPADEDEDDDEEE